MNRQETIEHINKQLPYIDDDLLKAVYNLLAQTEPLDAWEQEIFEDSKTGKLDYLINQAKADYKAGRVTKLAKD